MVDLNVPADTLIVYVGARDLGGSLGVGGPGGYSAGGTGPWLTTVSTRGEGDTQSPGAVDFGPWGGMLSFNNNATINPNWNFDHTVAPSAGQHDLYSVILHELAHLLGIGTADSWADQINGSSEFTGTASVAEFGGNVPLNGAEDHWADSTMSTIWGTATAHEAAMDPDITVGTRKLMTDLDMAALSDIGWEVAPVPEPSTTSLAVASILALAGWRYRRRAVRRD